MKKRFVIALILAAAFTVIPARALTAIARADFNNTSGDGSANANNPGVMLTIQGSIAPTNSAPTDTVRFLTESSFGHPFSPFQPRAGTGSATYATEIVATVRTKLYPPRGSTRSQVLNSGAAFRYKWLLFSPEPGEDDVTSHFQNMTNWYSDAERAIAGQQIAVLRDALAVSPLDTGLRDALLECYYDLAIAEMQFSKQSLATLASIHLGLTVTSPFVIDDEIKIYEQLITLESGVLAKYSELLSLTVEGVDPSSFDEREAPGKPMGLYTFTHQQPYRNAFASEYATDTGTEVIPDYDVAAQTAIPRNPDNLVLFSGYKDYVTLLQILGNYIAHNSELARLRGMRQGPNDLTKARNAITQILSQTTTDYHLLRGLVPVTFQPGDASGVNAAVTGVDTALADITNVRAFINGTANLLGLDSNFLLLVQGANLPNGYNNESFDVLYTLLRDHNQPLGDALGKLQNAVLEYQTFRGSVDRVVQSLDDVNDTYSARFVQITGYRDDEIPGFDGVNPKPNVTSDLLTAQSNLAALLQRKDTLSEIRSNLMSDVSRAMKAVTLASHLDAQVDAATNNYYNTTTPFYNDLITWTTASATAQATTDAIYSIADSDSIEGIVTAGVAGCANEVIQTIAANINSTRQRDIDYASMQFEASLQKADNALTLNQANQQVAEIARELYANDLELTDNTLAIAQGQAQTLALRAELNRIAANQQSDSELIRKSYYADPVHYVRSENALILADSAFRNAQRWLFYTQRALEYKWQQTFSRAEVSGQGVRSFDSGTVFKLQNALELDDLLTQLKAWNDDRLLQDIGNNHTTFISLRNDVLAPNPNVLNATPALRVDNGLRVDLITGDTVSQIDLFRRKLARSQDNAGNIVIPINTVNLAGLNGNFFVGPNYSGATIAPGEWRDKIVYLKVNVVAEDGTTIPRTIGGSLSYGGQMFFRTRMPPCVDRSYQFTQANTNDIPGEFFTAPFRFYFSAQYDNLFTARDYQTATISVAYTGATAISPTGEEILGSTYQVNDFNQRSVATSSLTLTLFASQVDIEKIKDIELIVRHHSSARVAPICN
jgi:hypothetical protein